jgi:hypothetical protein
VSLGLHMVTEIKSLRNALGRRDGASIEKHLEALIN